MKKFILNRRIAFISLFFVFVASPLVAGHRPGHIGDGGGLAIKDLITVIVSFLGF